jgi:hypothetical protein
MLPVIAIAKNKTKACLLGTGKTSLVFILNIKIKKTKKKQKRCNRGLN